MKVFVDTSALLAILDGEDPHHDAAKGMLGAALQRDKVFTHNYIHVEAEPLVRRRLGAPYATRLLTELLPAIETVWVDAELHAEAVAALSGKGRASSPVDQVSFALLRKLNVKTAIAFDSDFQREGYRQPEYERRHTLSEDTASYGAPLEGSDLVSVSELAARSGRSVNTIQSWRRRHSDFPAPSAELAAGPIWLWGEARAWIDQRSPRRTRAVRTG
ncbi:MAG: PIN domain-containing protein [Dehalococcoidia bacterium]|nr:MAG: PIN domain-containing protein [Dehalococcoidia bacterium]